MAVTPLSDPSNPSPEVINSVTYQDAIVSNCHRFRFHSILIVIYKPKPLLFIGLVAVTLKKITSQLEELSLVYFVADKILS